MKKNYKNRIFIFAAIILAANLIIRGRGFAIGEFSVGVNIGITYDANNLEPEISKYNTVLESYKAANVGTEVSQLGVPYYPLWGVNFRYQFNYLLFRLGCHLAKSLFPSEGSITPFGGLKNKIKITSYQNSCPVSIGFILPLKEKTYFFLGGGISYHQSYLKITQTNPSQSSLLFSSAGLSTSRRDRYTQGFVGFHMIFGAEIPFYKRLTVTTEWIHQWGGSHPLSNGGLDVDGNVISTPKKIIVIKGNFIIFGVNYYINI